MKVVGAKMDCMFFGLFAESSEHVQWLYVLLNFVVRVEFDRSKCGSCIAEPMVLRYFIPKIHVTSMRWSECCFHRRNQSDAMSHKEGIAEYIKVKFHEVNKNDIFLFWGFPHFCFVFR